MINQFLINRIFTMCFLLYENQLLSLQNNKRLIIILIIFQVKEIFVSNYIILNSMFVVTNESKTKIDSKKFLKLSNKIATSLIEFDQGLSIISFVKFQSIIKVTVARWQKKEQTTESFCLCLTYYGFNVTIHGKTYAIDFKFILNNIHKEYFKNKIINIFDNGFKLKINLTELNQIKNKIKNKNLFELFNCRKINKNKFLSVFTNSNHHEFVELRDKQKIFVNENNYLNCKIDYDQKKRWALKNSNACKYKRIFHKINYFNEKFFLLHYPLVDILKINILIDFKNHKVNILSKLLSTENYLAHDKKQGFYFDNFSNNYRLIFEDSYQTKFFTIDDIFIGIYFLNILNEMHNRIVSKFVEEKIK